jgi:hypothetical protein
VQRVVCVLRMAPGALVVLGGYVAVFAGVFIPAQTCWITPKAYTTDYYTIRKIPATSYSPISSHPSLPSQVYGFSGMPAHPNPSNRLCSGTNPLIYIPFGQSVRIVLQQILSHGETISTPSHKRCRDKITRLLTIAVVQKVEIITKRMNHTGSTVARMYNFSQSNESWTGAQIATQSGA